MKKYLTKWTLSIGPDKPRTRTNTTHTFVSLVKPTKANGTVGFERMMVADESWVRQNMGDIDLNGMELPEFFTTQLKGEEEE